MNHVYRTVNRYHNQFESFKEVIRFRNLSIWIFVLSVIGMIYSIFHLLGIEHGNTNQILVGLSFLSIFIFEVIAILAWVRIQYLRDKLVISSCQKRLKTDVKSIAELKALWFERTLDYKRTDYLQVASDIDKMIQLRDKHRSSFTFGKKQILNVVFSFDSKNRILAMFMGVCAIIVALSISSGASLENIYSFYREGELMLWISFAIILSILLMIAFLVIRHVTIFFIVIFENIFNMIDGESSTSRRRASNFINQLINQYELKKGRIRRP